MAQHREKFRTKSAALNNSVSELQLHIAEAVKANGEERKALSEEWTLIENVKRSTMAHLKQELQSKRQAHEAKIAEEKSAIAAERVAWEQEQLLINNTCCFEQKLQLDVGGSKFTTTLTTLRRFPESMIGAMFSGRHALPLDTDGCYFIDRDGTHFRHILNFLRDPEHFNTAVVDGDDITKMELLKEAEYYGLFEVMFPDDEDDDDEDEVEEEGPWQQKVIEYAVRDLAHRPPHTVQLYQGMRNGWWYASLKTSSSEKTAVIEFGQQLVRCCYTCGMARTDGTGQLCGDRYHFVIENFSRTYYESIKGFDINQIPRLRQFHDCPRCFPRSGIAAHWLVL